MKVESVSENVHIIRIPANYCSSKWEQWFLLLSDIHFDNPHCDRKLLFRHLDEAKKKHAPIFLNGDTFCMMQGKYDPRSRKSDVLPQHQVDDYLDAVIEECAEKLAPYGDLLTVIGRGNHEQSILKRHETDVIKRLCIRISEKCGREVFPGGYGGYLIPRFFYPDGSSMRSIKIKYHHGAYGGVVTKGVLGVNRRAVYCPDANIVTTGHIHEKWAVNITQETISENGVISLRNQLHICTGTYKEEYRQGASGWHVERGAPPKPLGGYFIRFTSKLKGGSVPVIQYAAMECV